jgi:hypothetical protein
VVVELVVVVVVDNAEVEKAAVVDSIPLYGTGRDRIKSVVEAELGGKGGGRGQSCRNKNNKSERFIVLKRRRLSKRKKSGESGRNKSNYLLNRRTTNDERNRQNCLQRKSKPD